MIAGISNQSDIDLYLESEEITRLEKETLEGVLIKTRRPKRQGTISISINEKRKYENGFGIGIYDKRYWGFEDGFHIDIFMGNECYEELKRRGVIGLRQRMRDGSKINVYDISKLNGLSKIGAEQLEFYRDNREKLSDLLG
ncbi:hypothetical protein J4422_01430 [Candidatus Pacearchaeota archaeon]|nr:hypothetical protein [Candidatus Pacearchaeota archaeon]